MSRRFRIPCGEEVHVVMLDDASNVVFVDHPAAPEQARAENTVAVLAGNSGEIHLEGCLRVAQRIQRGEWSWPCPTEERQLYATLRGRQIGRAIRKKTT